MATKIICDCCYNEITNNINKLDFPIWLEQDNEFDGYVSIDNNTKEFLNISKKETKDLCLKCYNIIITESFNKFKELKQQKK